MWKLRILLECSSSPIVYLWDLGQGERHDRFPSRRDPVSSVDPGDVVGFFLDIEDSIALTIKQVS